MLLKKYDEDNKNKFIHTLTIKVRNLVEERRYKDCYKLISEAMKSNPHAAEPHNLMGILMEREGRHTDAMKHFRASWGLDPTYLPARYNMEVFGKIFSFKKGAYDEKDCSSLK